MASPEPEFHLFPELPTEIRLQIWALAIPDRVLPITCTKGIRPPSTHRYAQRFSTPSPTPALLLTCRESRSIALSTYTSYFRTEDCPQGIYASFAHDTVSLPENTISYLGKQELEGIERLVVEVKDHVYFGYFNLEFLRGMSCLKTLELRVQNVVSHSWSKGAVYDICRDLKLELLEWPDWKVPEEIRILHSVTGLELCVINGREDLLLTGEE